MPCKVINMGDGVTGIMCGSHGCDHDSDGPWMVMLRDKVNDTEEFVKESDLPFYPPQTEEEEKVLETFLNGRVIIGGSCSCSKCGAIAMLEMDM